MWIKIPFNDWSKERLARGVKTATTRTKRYGKVGDTFSVIFDDGSWRIYEITKVKRTDLQTVMRYHYKPEGCETTNEFHKVWNTIHPHRLFDPDQTVWYHKFKEVK